MKPISQISSYFPSPLSFGVHDCCKGHWEMHLKDKKLYWSPNQFRLYGYEPHELNLNDKFFLLNTTHSSDIDRISQIIDKALENEDGYHFKRRIVKKSGALGFAETYARIIRSSTGAPDKIVGVTMDVSGEITETGEYNYNDPKFFNILYTNYYKAINTEVVKIAVDPDLAKDLCQEIFLKAWQHMAQYDPKKGELYTWLINIAKNHCKDYFRSKNHRAQLVTTSMEVSRKAKSLVCEGDHYGNNLKEMLTGLPPEQREIIDLLFFQGFTQMEVAHLKKLPLGTVKTKSRSAIIQLRKIALQANEPNCIRQN